MFNTMHLFAGAGGGLLADLILGHRPVVAVEWEPYACQVLRERAAEGWFPGLYVYEGDVRLFDPSEYAGSVDCIHAGFPCQDISLAGKQAGVEDGTRSGLYREVLRIAGVVRPRFLFLENVSAILSNGLGTVLADLAALGYDARWTCLRASEVGANHQRDRWWLLATLADAEHDRVQVGRRVEAAGKVGRLVRGIYGDVGQSREQQAEGSLADAVREREQRIVTECSDTQGRQEPQGRPDRSCGDGFGWWEAEPNVGRVADGVASRVDRLKACGNGQVPLQAAVAWKLLGGE